jgi:hypothetical protein
MATALARRVARLEAPKLPKRILPHVVTVATGETKTEAYRRHSASWGRIPNGHRFLVIPSREHDAEVFERDFHAQQTRLVADARASRPKEGNDNEFNARLYARQHSGSDTVRSGLATAHTARKVDWKPRQLRQ